MDTKKTITRRNTPPIKVYCLPDEKAEIQKNAERAGLSVAKFLREVGQGYEVKGIVDFQQVEVMAKINGDLGRLGGLLKLWLTNEEKTDEVGMVNIVSLLNKIEDKQDQLADVMQKIIMPRVQ